MEKQNWKTIEPQLWKPEQEGDMIEGILVNKSKAKRRWPWYKRQILYQQ